MDDTRQSLLARLQAGPGPGDWAVLLHVYAPMLRGWLRRAGLQDADQDDLVQDILTVVVQKLPEFRHGGNTGSFRAWLRTVFTFRLSWFFRQRRVQATGGNDVAETLAQLEAPHSDLSRQWDAEHDRHVVGRLLELVRRDFEATTWSAFQRYALDEVPAAKVAAELNVTVNVVHLSRYRVLSRLRQEAAGMIDA